MTADRPDDEPYRVVLSPGARRALTDTLPSAAAVAAWKFISGPLADNPHQVGAPPCKPASPPYDFTWAFVLREQLDGTTRPLVRERYAYIRRWVSMIVEPVEVASFVMTQRMLGGIREARKRRGLTV